MPAATEHVSGLLSYTTMSAAPAPLVCSAAVAERRTRNALTDQALEAVDVTAAAIQAALR